MNALEIYIDGACKGNPGPGGVGVVIYRGGLRIRAVSMYIGAVTNNTAEYQALICALEEARRLTADTLHIHSDSQLLCRQINREYKVRNEAIGTLFIRALNLISDFKQVSLINIPRENNQEADRLANQALKVHFKPDFACAKRVQNLQK